MKPSLPTIIIRTRTIFLSAVLLLTLLSLYPAHPVAAQGNTTFTLVQQESKYTVGQRGELTFRITNHSYVPVDLNLVIQSSDLHENFNLYDASGTPINLSNNAIYAGKSITVSVAGNSSVNYRLGFWPQRAGSSKIAIAANGLVALNITVHAEDAPPVQALAPHETFTFSASEGQKMYLNETGVFTFTIRNNSEAYKYVELTLQGDSSLRNLKLRERAVTIAPKTTRTFFADMLPGKVLGKTSLTLNVSNISGVGAQKFEIEVLLKPVQTYRDTFQYLDNDIRVVRTLASLRFGKNTSTGVEGYMLRFFIKNSKAQDIREHFTVRLLCPYNNYEDVFAVNGLRRQGEWYTFLIPADVMRTGCRTMTLRLEDTQNFEQPAQQRNNEATLQVRAIGNMYRVLQR